MRAPVDDEAINLLDIFFFVEHFWYLCYENIHIT